MDANKKGYGSQEVPLSKMQQLTPVHLENAFDIYES